MVEGGYVAFNVLVGVFIHIRLTRFGAPAETFPADGAVTCRVDRGGKYCAVDGDA